MQATQWVKVKLHSDELLLGPNFLLHLSMEAQREISTLSYVLGYGERELAKVMERAEKDNVPVLVRMHKLFHMYDECLSCGGVEDKEFQKRKEEKRSLLGNVLQNEEDTN